MKRIKLYFSLGYCIAHRETGCKICRAAMEAAAVKK